MRLSSGKDQERKLEMEADKPCVQKEAENQAPEGQDRQGRKMKFSFFILR